MSDYVLLPKFVFMALQKWYGCDKILQRDIISFKGTPEAIAAYKQGALAAGGNKNKS